MVFNSVNRCRAGMVREDPLANPYTTDPCPVADDDTLEPPPPGQPNYSCQEIPPDPTDPNSGPVGGSQCSWDLPQDLNCDQNDVCLAGSPGFFVARRLDSIVTESRNPATSGWDNVTKLQLRQKYIGGWEVIPGQKVAPALWLDYVRPVGLIGDDANQIRLPVVEFDAALLPVGPMADAFPRAQYPRVAAIANGLGGRIEVHYGQANLCPSGTALESVSWDRAEFDCYQPFEYWNKGVCVEWADPNRHRCIRWGPRFGSYGVYHKYLVAKVVEKDLVGGSPDMVTRYEYVGKPAWARSSGWGADNQELTWSEFRGYQTVRVIKGSGDDPEQYSVSSQSFYRGMYDDSYYGWIPKGTLVTDFEGNVHPDRRWLAGQVLQEQSWRMKQVGAGAQQIASKTTAGPSAKPSAPVADGAAHVAASLIAVASGKPTRVAGPPGAPETMANPDGLGFSVVLPLVRDLEVFSAASSSLPENSQYINVGSNFEYHRRALMKFDTASLVGKTVTSAALELWDANDYGCLGTNNDMRVSRITQNWLATVFWSTQPGVTADGAAVITRPATCPAGTLSWPITAIAQAWADGTANHGVQVRAVTEAIGHNSRYSVIRSSEYTGTNGHTPRLKVVYTLSDPGISGLAVTPSQVVNGTPVTSTLTPALSGLVSDPAGGSLTGEFQVEHDPTAPSGQGTGVIWSGASAAVTPGNAASVTLPAATLTDGWLVRWRARAVNAGRGTASAWSGWQTLKVDLPKPSVDQLQVTPSTQVNGQTVTSSYTPSLHTTVTHPSAASSTAEFEVEHAPSAPAGQGTGAIWSGSVVNVASGAQASATVPGGRLADRWQVRWRVRAVSGGMASAWSAWQALAVDTPDPTVSALQVTPSTQVNGETVTSSVTPSLRATLTDPENGTLTGQFEVEHAPLAPAGQGAGAIWSGSVAGVASGAQGSVTVPAAKLSDGWLVRWRARAVTAGSSSAWSAWAELRVDVPDPVVDQLQVTPSAQVNGTTATGSLTPALLARVTDPQGAVLSAEFELEHAPSAPAGQGTGAIWSGSATGVASGSQASVTVPEGKLTDGWAVRWRVRAVNAAAGSASSWTTWSDLRVDLPDPDPALSVNQPQVTPAQLVGGQVVTSSLVPQLHVTVSHPAGGPLGAEFQLEHAPSAPAGQGSGAIWSGSVAGVASGAQASVTVAAGRLANGWIVRWRARATKADAFSVWSAWQELRVDLPPPVVGDLQVSPSQSVNGLITTSSLTPELRATVTEPTGAASRAEFEVEHAPSAPAGQGSGVIWSGSVASVVSGGQATVSVPAATLSDGWQVRWRVRALNPVLSTASVWSPWQELAVDYPDPLVEHPQVTPSDLVDGTIVTTSLTPSLHVTVTDPAGAALRTDFEVEHAPSAPAGQGSGLIWSGSVPGVASGGQATVSVPAATLSDGWQVRWRARAASPSATSAWSSWSNLTVDRPDPVLDQFGVTPSRVTGGERISTSLTPQLSARVTESSGAASAVEFQLEHSPSAPPSQGSGLIWAGSAANVPSGGQAAVAVPAQLLTEGWKVRWRVRVASYSWSTWRHFTAGQPAATLTAGDLEMTPSWVTAGQRVTSTPSPTLSAHIAGARGTNLRAEFELQTSPGGALLWRGASSLVVTGGRASATVNASLSSGWQLRWRVRAVAGTNTSAWSPWQTFTYDRLAVDPGPAPGKYEEIQSTRHEYWMWTDAAGGEPSIYDPVIVKPSKERTRTVLADGGYRWGQSLTAYNNDGYPTQVNNHGDLAVPTDNTCTRTTYVGNTSPWILGLPSAEETREGDSCSAGRLLGKKITLYDGGTDPATNTPSDGNPTEMRSSINETAISTVRTTYDNYGRPTAMTDALGKTTTTVFNPAVNWPTNGVTATNPLGHQITKWTSPYHGNTVGIRGTNLQDTNIDYDALARTTTLWTPLQPKSGGTPAGKITYSIPYDGSIEQPTAAVSSSVSQLHAGAGANAKWLTKHTYIDGFGRKREIQAASPAGGRIVSVMAHNSRGQEWAASGPVHNEDAAGSGLLNPAMKDLASWSETVYDGTDNAVAKIDYNLSTELRRTTTRFLGDREELIDPKGNKTVHHVDIGGKVTKVEEWIDAVTHYDTTYEHDHAGKPTKIIDAKGNVRTFTYDLLGRRIAGTDPDSGSSTSTYDAAGRMISSIDGKGQKLSYVYDDMGRRTAQWAGEVGNGTRLAEWVYDTLHKGQLTSATRWTGGQPYVDTVTGYDVMGRPTGSTLSIPASEGLLAGNYSFSASYDTAGRIASVGMPAVGGLPAETITSSYSDQGLAHGLTSDFGGGFTYVKETRFSKTALPIERLYGASSQVRRSMTWDDGTGYLTNVRTTARSGTSSVNTAQDDQLFYDVGGNITRILDKAGSQSECFAYDALERLRQAWTTTAGNCASGSADGLGTSPYNLGYTYDAVGNITKVNSSGAESVYHYPASGPTAVRPNAVTRISGTAGDDTYAYDAAGQLLTRVADGKSAGFEWNELGQLAKAVVDGATTSMVYDADGERLIRREAGKTVLYLGSMELELAGGQVTCKRYYTSPDGATVALRTGGSGLTWLLSGLHGSEQLAIGDTTGQVSRQRYLPYGEQRGGDFLPQTDRGFLGKVEDAATGLTYLSARYYDPAIGKFISPDPLLDLRRPQWSNPYSYAGDNPIGLSDPTGLAVDPDDCKKGGKAGHCREERSRIACEKTYGKSECQQWRIAAALAQKTREFLDGCVLKFDTPQQFNNCVDRANWLGLSQDDWTAMNEEAFKKTELAQMMDFLAGDWIACHGGNYMACVSAALDALPGKKVVGLVGKSFSKLGTALKTAAKACSSFVPDTEVLMGDGTYKHIEDVKIGDKVLATDPETGKTAGKPVIVLISGEGDKELFQITVDTDGDLGNQTGVVTATAEHPFWVNDHSRWLNADQLVVGMRLLSSTGDTHKVSEMMHYRQLGARVRNLTVDELHSYHVAVGDSDVLVHNAAPCIKVSVSFGDWGTKGAHVYIGNKEARIFPDGKGGVGVVGIRLRNGLPSSAQLQQVADAIAFDSQLRASLIRNAKDMMARMNRGELGMKRNRAAEMHFLIKALEKMG
ncbi:polymorphic toxin-type HINT domain-containing protein [Rhizohabitans arisaemae]|uniref:polymorphic toxin-type HINT domain-containing protein n=1 Tax=Rhizohabitans arisaemae TaxID=2720610 RepID=UPI0024B0DF6F|nr:polymorphic toxin-type HINT domain-containing protein [Rhizohabitans arisaemae]